MTNNSPDTDTKSSEPDSSNDALSNLLHVMARLRDPENGCPWDVVQSFETIAPYTIEEAYEVSEAIRQKDMSALREELGDLLFQVVFHARMAEEEGHFTFHDVAEDLSKKMIRRHPHVFAEKSVASADAQTLHWEDLKAAERAEKKAARADQSILADVPLALPALMRAEKLQKRAARVGFDWPEVVQVFDKIDEELNEIKAEIEVGGSVERLSEEVGDLLFAAANLARHLKVDPEVALREGNGKFEKRFRAVEAKLGDELQEASLEEMEEAWQQVKSEKG